MLEGVSRPFSKNEYSSISDASHPISSTTSAVLHNTSTLCIGLRSMKNLVSEEELQ